ncbi:MULTISPECIES: thiol-disulfide oxidoreductase DCC family protein [Tenacibaculum]|uniref:thiol-disulfide oxidoreductase DCC family protein n=1 Tax=Tenacibaculum TaxID=104267 RepID=UPI001F0B602E|nr:MULTISPECIES: thiol-disulfide oxidoreductase DCC family protein [Tenacibaculum]MCH3882640.1 thiol-disulfide oxidoreductase DCC family protein [Tenacibaculum aquimarinum]MDO6600324.1 thiol-disulfide oxidoreductase DCC family protein [Tenacibaculum sp. 1_MG-2023]
MMNIPKGKKLILFDGVCNLCNNAVLKIIKFDKHHIFVFASLQSNIGQEITNHLKIDVTKIDSIILVEENYSYTIKSSAALKIAANFGGFWKMTQLFWVFPSVIRNLVYDFIAKNRYKWFGKKESCMIPTKELKSKFIE